MVNSAFGKYYGAFLSQYYAMKDGEEKQVWEWIRERKLTACPHFVGNKYEDSKLRLMVVGRAVNGWEVNAEECTSLENSVEMILQQENRFEDVAKKEGIPYIDERTGEEKVYYYSRSNFWKLIRYILELSGEGEDYHQRIVWSNLYKIAPYDTGNPDWKLVKPRMQGYIDCLLEEIRTYKPSHILFVTGMDYLNPWKKEPQFGMQLGVGQRDQTTFGDKKYESGVFEGAKIVVCGRPENKSNEAVKEMAQIILSEFKR